ncbi:MAG: zinc ribbon domain-containing protein [Planctomycetota bacterium]|nr:MAG: zinc ribbon domain-containing protein [Planctomycetota bacterium]
MPTYDYACRGCGHSLEIFHSMKEAPKKKCPKCGKNKLERQIGGGAGVIFKGSGFYSTDYRSESYKAGEKSASTASTAPSAPSAGADCAGPCAGGSGACKNEPSKN